MARTIQSPGVEINEIDLSLRPNLPVGTSVLVAGFAQSNVFAAEVKQNHKKVNLNFMISSKTFFLKIHHFSKTGLPRSFPAALWPPPLTERRLY